MTERTALKAALGLFHLPASVRRVRSEPLPPGIETLLKIAAGDDQAEVEAALLTERPRPVIREAAAFYVEQVLLSPSSDSYRVLGATPAASIQDLRRNMALLLSWLHPDKTPSNERAVFAARVTGAWNDLRSPDRRAAYDAALEASQANRGVRSHSPSRALNAAKNNGEHLSVPHHRAHVRHDAGLFRNENHDLLRKGWSRLRRLLGARSTP